MAWFRPDLFSRVIAYSATLVAQQDPKAPESAMYPHGAWDYHSDLELIKNDTMGREKLLRIFHNANEMDNGATAAESGRHNWLMAGMRTAAALKAKGFHYKFVEGLGAGHCAGQVQSATLADGLGLARVSASRRAKLRGDCKRRARARGLLEPDIPAGPAGPGKPGAAWG